MGNSLLAVRGINHKYIVVERGRELNLENCRITYALDCFLTSVATIAKSYGRDYYMIASGAWKLEYYADNNNSIGEKIDLKNSTNIIERAKKYHGFMWCQKSFSARDTDLIQKALPVIVEIDLYNFPLSQYFNKYHFLHNFIICSFNKARDEFHCVDPYFQNSVFDLKKQSLLEIVDKYYVIDFFDTVDIDSKECIKEIEFDFKRMSKDKDSLMNIDLLCRDIINTRNINLEFDQFKNDFSATPILNKLRKIYISRSSSAFVLDEINRNLKKAYINEACELIKKSARLWKFIQSKILKCYLTEWGENEKVSIYRAFNQISNIEKNAIEIILAKRDE